LHPSEPEKLDDEKRRTDGEDDGNRNYEFSSYVQVCRLKKKYPDNDFFFSTETFKQTVYKCPLPM
jgi:hypothetical protein